MHEAAVQQQSCEGITRTHHRCVETMPGELRVVQNLVKRTTQTGREMRLTTQNRKYEMDQVILDLGSDANIQPK